MGLTWDIFLTGLCGVSLGILCWWLFGRLLRPMSELPTLLVIPGRGRGERLEQTVRALIWLRGMGLLSCPIVIADVDLTSTGWELALRLTARWPEVILWPASDLAGYLKEQEW